MKFYKQVIIFVIPIMLQRLMTNATSIIDTIMLSQIGVIAGLAIASQVDMIMNNIAYGLNSGIGIFIAQYFGKRDFDKIKKLFSLQVIIGIINGLLFYFLISFFKERIVSFYVEDVQVVEDAYIFLDTVKYAYIGMTLIGTMNVVYRSVQKTMIPFIVGFIVMITNILGNYLFIYGNMGLPQLGIRGAAIATIIATYIGLVVHVVVAIVTKQEFLPNKFKISFKDLNLQEVANSTLPLVFNEFMFGLGMTMYIKVFATLGVNSLEAYKVASTIISFFFVTAIGLNSAVASFIGETLGTKDYDKAKKEVKSFVKIAIVGVIMVGVGIFLFDDVILNLFGNLNEEVYSIANMLLLISIARISLRLLIVVFLGALKAGGDTKIIMWIDSGITWIVGIPLAFILTYLIKVESVAIIYLAIQTEVLVRLIFSYWRYKKELWIKNIT